MAIDLGLAGRRALVTGASRGIGRAIALHLARAGADVCIAYRTREEEALAVAEQARGESVRAHTARADLAVRGAADELVADAVESLGGLDIFVANAGVWPAEYVPFGELSAERWRATLALNLDGLFEVTRAAVRRLADGGRLVLISSTAGQRGEPGHADYAASKAALAGLVKSLAVELAPRGITVNCVAPGWVDTEMCEAAFAGGGRARIEAGIPLGRVAEPEDVAGPVVFLCSRLARHVTGTTVSVNGGAVL
ncbi:MAG: SDR family NAD(P)-dependent oxidoreductase [Gemmatimonadota bacterium]